MLAPLSLGRLHTTIWKIIDMGELYAPVVCHLAKNWIENEIEYAHDEVAENKAAAAKAEEAAARVRWEAEFDREGYNNEVRRVLAEINRLQISQNMVVAHSYGLKQDGTYNFHK